MRAERQTASLMCNEGILGGQVSKTIDINQEALHLTFQPVVMPILLLVKGHKKLSVSEDTSMLLGSWSICAVCGFSRCWCTCSASQRIYPGYGFNTFNILCEALVFGILKTYWLLGRLRVYCFSRDIHIWQEDAMVSGRGLLRNYRVQFDQPHHPRAIELQTK